MMEEKLKGKPLGEDRETNIWGKLRRIRERRAWEIEGAIPWDMKEWRAAVYQS
jgi:hypothetical protein